MAEIKSNREFKDRVFRDLFGAEERKGYALSLYNALAGTDHDDPADLQLTTLDNALYMNVRNDVSFLIGSEMVLWEHQSTWNPNMPLRGLEYFGKLYSKYTDSRKSEVYAEKQMELPTPRYVVFYNGPSSKMKRNEFRLSDAYEGDGDVEIVAHVIDVNADSEAPALQRCEPLSGYAVLVAKVRGFSEKLPASEAVDAAIDWCISHGILMEYLSSRRAEVKAMFMEELSEEEIHGWYREWGLEEGLKEGREEGRKLGLAEGRTEGRAEGLAEGHKESLAASIQSLMETTGWDAERAMDALKVPAEERALYLKRLGS